MLDDAGFAHPDTFGGAIHTPTLTRLAKTGISYNAFHTTAMCSPTRASLLTGRNHHRVGNGQIAECANDWDGYSGVIPRSAATIAEILRYYGYVTSAFGKWHNTPATETSVMGPFDRWPTGHGFDYFYGFLGGETSQYEPRLYENTNAIEPPHSKDYHLTNDMADKEIQWMRNRQTYAPDQPFLLYWTPGAVHGPHHVHQKWIDKYKGKFDDGWDVYREQTFKRQRDMGWIPKTAKLTPRHETMPAWDSLSPKEKRFQARLMEVYAGFLEHTDTQAGRLVDELERLGIRDNTIIFYIVSDNGASAEGMQGSICELLAQNGIPTTLDQQLQALETYGGLDALGGPKMDSMYHSAWAWAGSTPFGYVKLVASHFGGTRTPLVISWPEKIKPDNTPRPQFHHVNDIAPTLFDILGITPPQIVDGHQQDPIDGVSMTYSFADPKAKTRKKTQYFEIMGSRSIFTDGWIASAVGPRIPWVASTEGLDKWTPDQDSWELYDLSKDYSQAKDLAKEQPKKLAAMKELFIAEAAKNKVFPVGGGLFTVLNPDQIISTGQTKWKFFEGMVRTPEFVAPKIGSRNNLVTVDATMGKDTKGVLYALCGIGGGVSLYVDKGKLVYEYNALAIQRTKLISQTPIPNGRVKIEVETKFQSPKRATPADIMIRVNGKQVAGGTVPLTVPTSFSATETFDVGMDLGSPVSLDYYDRAPFRFTGRIHGVEVRYVE